MAGLPVGPGGSRQVGGFDRPTETVALITVRSDHTVRAWGDGHYGSLGNGGATDSSVPVTVLGLTGAVAVAGGNAAGWAAIGP